MPKTWSEITLHPKHPGRAGPSRLAINLACMLGSFVLGVLLLLMLGGLFLLCGG